MKPWYMPDFIELAVSVPTNPFGFSSFTGNSRVALWTAFFYGFSPVFVRYNHWATGRGLFLALFPLFILSIIRLPGLKAWGGLLLTGLLMTLSHKAGCVAVPALLLSLPDHLPPPLRLGCVGGQTTKLPHLCEIGHDHLPTIFST